MDDPNIIAESYNEDEAPSTNKTQAFNTDVLARRVKGKASKPKSVKPTPQQTKSKGKKVCILASFPRDACEPSIPAMCAVCIRGLFHEPL